MTTNPGKNYFVLDNNCILVEGAIKGAAYDLKGEEIYSVNKEEFSILKHCESYYSIEEISKIVGWDKNRIIEFLEQVKKLMLGSFYSTPVFSDKFLDYYQDENLPKSTKIESLIIEIHRKCDLNCLFCPNGNNSAKIPFTYCGCRKKEPATNLTGDTIKKLIMEAQNFGVQSIFFTGGDPFFHEDEMIELLKFSNFHSANISVHTHSTNLDDKCIEVLRELDIALDIPIYSYDEKTHDSIVGVSGHFNKLISTFEKLLEKNVKFASILYISDFNAGHVEKTVNYFKQIGCNVVHKFIYPDTGIENNSRFIAIYNKLKKDFSPANISSYLRNKHSSVCLPQKIAVTADGNIAPCHIADRDILGNINSSSISHILRGHRLGKYWSLSKEKSKTCNLCEYRYTCSDCPILEHDREYELIAENKYCRYDPLIGEWLV